MGAPIAGGKARAGGPPRIAGRCAGGAVDGGRPSGGGIVHRQGLPILQRRHAGPPDDRLQQVLAE